MCILRSLRVAIPLVACNPLQDKMSSNTTYGFHHSNYSPEKAGGPPQGPCLGTTGAPTCHVYQLALSARVTCKKVILEKNLGHVWKTRCAVVIVIVIL